MRLCIERRFNAALEGLGFDWLQLSVALTLHAFGLLEAYLSSSPTFPGIEVFRGATTVRWPPAKRDGQPAPTFRMY
jgi:hypothetical protein